MKTDEMSNTLKELDKDIGIMLGWYGLRQKLDDEAVKQMLCIMQDRIRKAPSEAGSDNRTWGEITG